MTCDKCDEQIPQDVNGGIRLRLPAINEKEIVVHLCEKHQAALSAHLHGWLILGRVREVRLS